MTLMFLSTDVSWWLAQHLFGVVYTLAEEKPASE